MDIEFAIRSEERNDTRALAVVKANALRYGYKIDRSRKVTCRRNGGLWCYVVPVLEEIAV